MALTPMMKQYLSIKEKSKDCILFFRLGDFYEMFFEDAEIVSKELELVLTGRDCGLEKKAPMCGVPYHAANAYIGRLISKGFKIAICEQVEDPAQAKGIVKRDIVKIITPGTYTESTYLEENKNNYIMSLYINDKTNYCGISFTDISTGEFYCTDAKFDLQTVFDEIYKFNPTEIVISNSLNENIYIAIKERFNLLYSRFDENSFIDNEYYNSNDKLAELKQNHSEELIYSITGLLNYIKETQKDTLSNIISFEYYNTIDYLTIDGNSRRNLELTQTIHENSKKGSLLWVLDKTNTAMGGRQLRKWLEQPLIDKTKIENRLESVEELVNNISVHEDLKESLKDIYDIERIIGKISSKSVTPKELLSLKNSVEKLPKLNAIMQNCNSKLIKNMNGNLDLLEDIYSLLDKSINDNPSVSLKDGNIIKDGYDSEIDKYRKAKLHGREWIANLEQEERKVTGIKSLKVGYNKVFGYYIEISKPNLHLIPDGRYIRKQTLSNAERYITPELKEMEEEILSSEEKLTSIEYDVFIKIRDTIETEIKRMKKTANIISNLDCLSSLASVALEYNYVKPKINNNGLIDIKDGRHPVVERMLSNNSFVENDTYLNNIENQMMLITGPNMAGKSTYMRQVALITIMAQLGSFVPASSADISICDKIFTRIGASDDLASGKSTFMVEMWEVSNILKNATNKSLVLLDEVGRGTSTYDGLSIAWAVIEYICNNPTVKCKTMFATHYHELIKLEDKIDGLKNYSVSVKQIDDDVVFLRKIIPGGTDESYGIEVAKLAGIPNEVIERAKEILTELEKEENTDIKLTQKENITISERKSTDKVDNKKESINIFEPESKVDTIKQLDISDISKNNLLEEIKSIDILNYTPMEGFNKLYEIIQKSKNI